MSYHLLRRYGGLALLLIIYLSLVMAYSYAIPFSKGPDEYINYQYILFIAKHHHLPRTILEREEAGVKADWQPLYHLVGGLVATPVSLTSPPELKVTWEPPTRQLIDIVLPRATLIRTEDERPPYRGVYALWQVGRWVSMSLGAGTLVVTYFIVLTLWPGQPAVATSTTALLVFIPRFLFTHAVLSDDTLLGFFLALYLLLLVRLIRWRGSSVLTFVKKRGWSAGNWLVAGLGIMAGLAIVTKYAAIPLVVGAFITGGLVAYRQKWPWQDWLRWGAIFAGSLLLAIGWWIGWVWWYFNQVDSLGLVVGLVKPLLPGATVDDNPTTSRLTALFSGQSVTDLGEAPGAGGTFLDWAWHSFVTFWGVTVFGAEPQWPYPYNVILIGIALLCVGAVVGLWRVYRGATASDKMIWQAFGLHLLLFLPLPLLRFALSRRLNDAAQGRHLLFPAGVVIIIMLMAGWLVWIRPRWRNQAALTMAGLMLVWGIGHLFYLLQAYPPPLPVRTTSGSQVEAKQLSEINFDDILLLTDYQTHLAADGSTLKVELQWRSLAQAWEDYRTEITLVDSRNQPQLRWISHPVNGRFPVRAWQLGDMVRDTLHIPLVDLPSGDYELQLRLLGWDQPLSSDQGVIANLTTVTVESTPKPDNIALWQQQSKVAELSKTSSGLIQSSAIYRYRSTIPVTLPQSADAILIDPHGQPRLPIADLGHLRVFMVDYDWPSGEYRLQVDGVDGNLGLQVDNFDQRRQGGWNFSPPEMMYAVQANFADKIELLGYDLPLRRVEAGGGIPLVLYWRSLTQMREDYTIFVQLLDSDLQRRGGYDRLPRETYNTYLWVPGEIVDDGFAVPVDIDAPDGIYSIRIGWYLQKDNQQIITLPLMQDGLPLPETSLLINSIKVGGPPAGVVTQEFSPEYPLNITFGEIIELRGYDLNLNGAELELTLYWQSLARTDTDYTVFVHLQNKNGETVAQLDGPPVKGQYPTSLWDSGEVIPDKFILSLPPDIDLEGAQLAVGLYDPMTGVRLTVPETVDNRVLLTKIDIN